VAHQSRSSNTQTLAARGAGDPSRCSDACGKSMSVGNGYAVYEQQHAIYDQFDEVRYFMNEAKFDEMRRFELRSNDLIMSCPGTMGCVAPLRHRVYAAG